MDNPARDLALYGLAYRYRLPDGTDMWLDPVNVVTYGQAAAPLVQQANDDLNWLIGHGKLDSAAQRLAAMRYMTECLERWAKTEWVQCPSCGGSGLNLKGDDLCTVCKGRKVVEK